jgi:hypothetical protein
LSCNCRIALSARPIDHGVTGYITGRGAVILNHEIPEKYRLAEQEQAYKNGYAKGFAEEQVKAERRVRRPSPPPARPEPPVIANAVVSGTVLAKPIGSRLKPKSSGL